MWFVFLGRRQQEERRASKMVSVRWEPDLIQFLDYLEVCVCVSLSVFLFLFFIILEKMWS